MLCHGGPGLWDDQEPVARMVHDSVRVHRWDQRGCGRSTGPEVFTVARFIADLETLRFHFGHERWLVGGHSWGASLALRYALAYPDRVGALLYLSGTGLGRAWQDAYRAQRERRLSPEQHRRRNELKRRERSAAEEREYRILSWAPDYGDSRRALELAAREADTYPFRINHACNAALNAETDAEDGTELLAGCRTLDVPVLIVDGAKDPRPAWAVDSMVEALPDVERHIIPEVGHVPWLEDRDGFARILKKFLGRLTGRAT